MKRRGKAAFIKTLDGFRGDARLYKLNPAIPSSEFDDQSFKYVVVSGVEAMYGPETFIFGADEDGKVVSFLELDGSFQGDIDHERALRKAGYKVREICDKGGIH